MEPNSRSHLAIRMVVTLLAAFAVVAPVMADPPPWAGGGKGKGEERDYKKGGDGGRDDRRNGGEVRHFDENHHVVVRGYYDKEFQGGHCPPGLAKKHNGCMPPGKAKKWTIGRPLPPEVVRYDLPPALIVQLGVPPPGYRYVRVATDILMIAVGTSMVADAIRDLGRK